MWQEYSQFPLPHGQSGPLSHLAWLEALGWLEILGRFDFFYLYLPGKPLDDQKCSKPRNASTNRIPPLILQRRLFQKRSKKDTLSRMEVCIYMYNVYMYLYISQIEMYYDLIANCDDPELSTAELKKPTLVVIAKRPMPGEAASGPRRNLMCLLGSLPCVFAINQADFCLDD